MQGSGGLGAVSAGISEWVVWLLLAAVLILVVLGGIKVVKLLWAAFSG